MLFPFIHNPKQDTWPTSLNTDGTYILKGIDYLKDINTNKDTLPELYDHLDMENLIINGHSMGATCTIAASKALEKGTAKVAIAQHPGLCGPFGPPPYPYTWMPGDLAEVMEKMPFFMTTATNDSAFLPAPYTAHSENGCYDKSLAQVKDKTLLKSSFIQFDKAVCTEDHKHAPFDDQGHDCAFKHEVETPWVLTAMKLYGMHGADSSTNCHRILWGSDADSLKSLKSADKMEIHDGAEYLKAQSFLQ